MGRLLLASPDALGAFHRGRITPSTLDLLARYCPPDRVRCLLPLASSLSHGELRELLQDQLEADCGPAATASEPEPGWEKLQVALPVDLLPYYEETLELARALAGRQVEDHEALDAILAEASGELSPGGGEDPPPRGRRRASRRRLRELPPLDGSRRDRRVARRLHALSLRLLEAQRRLQLDEEDELLALLESGSHRKAGYANFEHYCSRVLRLAPRTAWDRIRRARRRRAGDPIARARAEGRLTAVQFDLLSGLRELGVDAAALPAWIDRAPRVTTRRLQEMMRWARIQSATRHEEWARQGFASPHPSELRASSRPLEEILAEPEPPAIEALATSASRPLRLRLPSALADALRSAMAGLQRRSRDERGRQLPRWWAFLQILGLARLAWDSNVQDPAARSRMQAVFSRDLYRCQAPDCSWRRDLQSHHLRYRSRGGGDELSNLLTLCPFHHHQGEHGGLTRVRGEVLESPDDLEWELGLDENGENPILRTRGDEIVDPEVEGVRLAPA